MSFMEIFRESGDVHELGYHLLAVNTPALIRAIGKNFYRELHVKFIAFVESSTWPSHG